MRVPAILAIVFVLASTATAQSLADVARKESARREAARPAAKTYTNKDLKPVPTPAPAPAPAADAAPAGTSAGTAQATPADKPASETPSAAAGGESKSPAGTDTVRDQAYWAQQMASLRERLDRDQTYIDALQSRINALTTDFVNRDDPIQRDQIGVDRQKAVAELDRLKQVVEQDRRAITDFEEEARRAGVPAGWLR